jgi:hypothetical protein
VGIHHRIGRFRVAIILGSSLAVLSSIALAQDTEQWLTGTGPQPQMADSSKKPKLNVGGCWQGPEETLDSQGNVLDQGQLYIDFIQRGSKLLAPVHNCNISIAGTLQTDTGGDQHPVGTQPQTGFSLTVQRWACDKRKLRYPSRFQRMHSILAPAARLIREILTVPG